MIHSLAFHFITARNTAVTSSSSVSMRLQVVLMVWLR